MIRTAILVAALLGTAAYAAPVDEYLAKVLEEASEARRAIGRMEYAAERAVEERAEELAEKPGEVVQPVDPVPAPVPTPEPAPTPAPAQPGAAPSIAFLVGGAREQADCAPSGTVTTHTGMFRYHDCGVTPGPLNTGPQVLPGRVGIWTMDGNPDWYAVDIGAFAPDEPFDGKGWPSNVFQEARHVVSINGGEPVTVRVAPGSVKTLDNGSPVPLTAERVREAVAAHLLPRVDKSAYARYGMTAAARPSLPEAEYDPAILYAYDGRRSPLGDTSSTGGENEHGRAAMSEWDANLIALAMSGDAGFNAAADVYLDQMRWARAMPYETVQSRYGPHMLDPQKVIDPRDMQYTVSGRETGRVILNRAATWQRPADYPAFAGQTLDKHQRDLEHAHNMGEVWYAATGDPRAALHLQARTAWALAYPYWRWTEGRYNAIVSSYVSERATLNAIRDTVLVPDLLADTAEVEGETPLWGDPRWRAVQEETWATWTEWRDEALAGDDLKALKVRYFGDVDEGGTSPFMMHKYGLPVAYRLADRGYPQLMEQFARGWLWRFGEIGGTAGYYPKSTGQFEVDFPPAEAWGEDGEGAIAWWAAADPTFTARRQRWTESEQSAAALTAFGFEMLQDLVARGKLAPVEGLDEAAERNAAITRADPGKWPAYNGARFAVVPWE